jgi:hypothetical protein
VSATAVATPATRALTFQVPQYTWPAHDKAPMLLDGLTALTRHHLQASPPYARLVQAMFPPTSIPPTTLAELPYVPVGVFKSHTLQSIPDSAITTVLHSSGTTGQRPSRVVLDHETAQAQRAALASIMGTLLGPRRLPMLVLDAPAIVRARGALTARGAGVLGMMTFGGAHTFALRDDLTVDVDAVLRFAEKFGGAPFLLFGFTFLAWQALGEELPAGAVDLSQGVLVHAGGWKALAARAVDDAVFKRTLRERTGLTRIHNFYGMVEQVGSVFLEGDDGLLSPPDFADVLIRDPRTLEVVPHGTEGVIQVVSLLPRSYPGHSILTEDRGVIVHEDAPTAARCGKAFRVLGRVPRAELRGCSDVIAAAAR